MHFDTTKLLQQMLSGLLLLGCLYIPDSCLPPTIPADVLWLLCISQFQASTPPPGGNFFEVVTSPAPGQNFSAEARPPGQENTCPRDKKTPTPGKYFERFSQLFLLIDVEILEFRRNQTLKRTGRLSNYSLVIPSSFSLSTILKVLEFSQL